MIIETASPPPPTNHAQKRAEQHALGLFAIGAIAIMVWVSRPVGVGLFLGTLTAFMLQPLHVYLLRRTGRPWLAQLLCLLVAATTVIAVVAGISAVLVARGTVMGKELLVELEPQGKLRGDLGVVNAWLAPLGIHVDKLIDELRDAASSVASFVASIATEVAGKTFHAMLTFFFVLLTTSFVLVRGAALEAFVEDTSPLSRRHTRALISEIRKVGKATLLGSVVTGLAQGLLAYAIFAATGVPEPLFFGVATAVASLFPGVGTLLVWVPAGIYLLATGHIVRGVFELAASGLLVIGFADYVLRPRLVGGDSMPTLLTFAALFGGVEVFGLVGLLVGPLLMAVGVAVLRLYRADLLETPPYVE